MGTTPTPVKMLLLDLPLTPELEKLREQGHEVHLCNPTDDAPIGLIYQFDMILGPRCYRLRPDLMEFLSLALKEARAYVKAARPKAKKRKKSGAN